MSQAKMTPGPWHASNIGIGPHGRGPYTYPLGRDPDEAAANARAIACLPELVEIARATAALLNYAEPAIYRQAGAKLTQILGRIDGEGE